MNSTPPAVTIGPPAFGVPVLGTPFFVSSSYSPSGTRQANSPVFALIAISSPHGGALQGYPSGSSKLIFRLAYDGRIPDETDGCNWAIVPRLRVLTKINPRLGSKEAPDQLPPPSELGKTRLGTIR